MSRLTLPIRLKKGEEGEGFGGQGHCYYQASLLRSVQGLVLLSSIK
jgi:hypothetical protein